MDKNSARAALRRNRFTTRFPEAIGAIGCSAIKITADLVGGIGWIGVAARIVVDGTIAAAGGVTIAVDVLTVVVGAMAGAITNPYILLFSSNFSKTQYSKDVVYKPVSQAGFLVVTY